MNSATGLRLTPEGVTRIVDVCPKLLDGRIVVALAGCQATYENRALERFLKLGSLSRGASQVRLGRRVWHQTEGPFGGQHPRFQDLPQTLPSARDSSNPACQQIGRNHNPQRGDEPSELRE